MNAYMTAYFYRVEKLERFETYRSRLDQAEETKPKQMSNEDMLAKVMALHNSMNGETVNETGVGE